MPTGVIINSLSIVLGGIFGALLGHKLSHRLKTEITLIFGICAMADDTRINSLSFTSS